MQFEFLKVIERTDDYICPGNGKHYVRYKCQCVCGSEVIVNALNLKNGSTKSCGCKDPHRFMDLSGRRFGNIVVKHRVSDYINPSGRKLVRYLCECDCGNKIYELANTLRNNDVKSCGCILRSKGEDYVRSWLDKHNLHYELHKTFPGCLSDIGNKLSYDFWIPNLRALIECNGIQHYEPIEFFGGQKSFDKQVLHDELKKSFALNNSYHYLILDCRKIIETDLDNQLTNFINAC